MTKYQSHSIYYMVGLFGVGGQCHDHISPMCHNLQWLLVFSTVADIFKTAILVWNCVHGIPPVQFTAALHICEKCWNLEVMYGCVLQCINWLYTATEFSHHTAKFHILLAHHVDQHPPSLCNPRFDLTPGSPGFNPG